MNKTDDQLIQQFMQANKREIADHGFSHRVMRRLPKQIKNPSDILTLICMVVSCFLFYIFDGISLIYTSIMPAIQQSTVSIIENLNFQTLIPIAIVCTYLGIQKAISLSE